jgi:hypothetical protein
MVTELARLYSDAFAPEYFVLLCTPALVGQEWRRRRFGPVGLSGRALAVVAGWAVAFAIYESTAGSRRCSRWRSG